MAELGTAERPLRVAIVGAGPSGFYAADPLLKADKEVVVDMYDRLPTPFGLVRGGVAPDHEKIRLVTKVYERIASQPGFNFYGNIKIGRDVAVPELQQHYDAIIFACGAESDRRMNIPGEDLEGSYTATAFVGWYNGHPDYRDCAFRLDQEVAVIIGVGNVAMDVARVLAKTVDELRYTDMAQHALDALNESKVKQVHVVGRRGPAQAKFTPKELKEMGGLAACDPVVDPDTLQLNTASYEEMSDAGRRRNIELLTEYAEREPDPKKPKRMYFHFLRSPKAIRGEQQVEAIVLEKNRLEGLAFEQRCMGTGETLELPCGLVFRSIGYRGKPIPGMPFQDKYGVFPNEDGRVLEGDAPRPGAYVVGWIKRGPTGILGANKPDSGKVVQNLLQDVPNLPPCQKPDTGALLDLIRDRGVRVVTLDDWHKIDQAEIARGEAAGKPREKFTRIEDMLAVLD